MTLPTREEARRWRDADTDNKIYMAYCDGVLQTRAEWEASIDYEAAISHLEWLRGLRLSTGNMAEVFGAGLTGEWGGDDD